MSLMQVTMEEMSVMWLQSSMAAAMMMVNITQVFKRSMSWYFLLTLNLIVASKGLLESTAGPGDNNNNNKSFLKAKLSYFGAAWTETRAQQTAAMNRATLMVTRRIRGDWRAESGD